MSVLDMIVIAAGLLFGYRLVSNYLSPSVDESEQRPRSADARQEPPQPEWQHHWEPPKPAWFDVLGVPEHADLAQIERAYRQKISQYHPDKVALLGDDIRQLAETKSKEINAAYDAAVKLRGR